MDGTQPSYFSDDLRKLINTTNTAYSEMIPIAIVSSMLTIDTQSQSLCGGR
jgi:hypothetical protein